MEPKKAKAVQLLRAARPRFALLDYMAGISPMK
jgi:hypothetical protein